MDTENKRHTHIPPFALNTSAYGHGRTSRKRDSQSKGHTRGVNHHHGSLPMNIEKNTLEAIQWRNKRNLANAVAMPTPTITGAQLLQAGRQLMVVPKPRKLTTILERRAA